ncbi:MAG: hypothetical protein JW702_11145 [Clostridiales bacterium]|nr:hypothetical protein [Clostridiales bacterium]
MENRTLEEIHYDVGLANNYRIEYIKHLMSLSAGIFVISIAFMSDLVKEIENAEHKVIIILGWGFLIISLIGGIFHMKCWDRFYISYRKEMDIGNIRRKKINKYRILAEIIQVSSFLTGIIFIFLFVSTNL